MCVCVDGWLVGRRRICCGVAYAKTPKCFCCQNVCMCVCMRVGSVWPNFDWILSRDFIYVYVWLGAAGGAAAACWSSVLMLRACLLVVSVWYGAAAID